MNLGFILLSTGQEIAPKLSREISKKLTKAFFSNSIGSTSKVMFMLCIRFCICIYRVPQQGNIYYLYNTSKVIFVSCIRFCIYIYDIYIYIYIWYIYIYPLPFSIAKSYIKSFLTLADYFTLAIIYYMF